MNLFVITISTTNQPNTVRLVFRSEERANEAFNILYDGVALRPIIKDDYGNTVSVPRELIASVVLTDFARAAEGEQEATILNAHAQIRLEKRAASDMEIRSAQAGAALCSGLLNGSARA